MKIQNPMSIYEKLNLVGSEMCIRDRQERI